MTDDDLALASASELAALIRAKTVSSRELLDVYLRRTERLNPALNAVVTIDSERAALAAQSADEMVAAGQVLGPLHGLPFTVKDAIEVGQVRSTGGSRRLGDHVPECDAPAVARLRSAGAVVFGKTNCPEWSADIQTHNDLFGTTSNPWDLSLTTGGSSGGSAAAVAAGLTSFELGTDIGGSIRIPSSFCGVCGHKPSFGAVSQLGYLDRVGGGTTSADINVFGPIARSVDDLELLLSVLGGPDPEDDPAWSLRLPPRGGAALEGYRVGLWLDDPSCRVDRSIVEAITRAAGLLEGAGAKVAAERPAFELEEAVELFEALVRPAISMSVDGEAGRHLGGNHRDWLELKVRQTAMRQAWSMWFEDFDVLLCPVLPMLPFAHDHHGDLAARHIDINGESRSLAGTLSWTGLVGVAYLPSTVVPIGTVAGPSGRPLPVGVQVVGPYLGDLTTMAVARRLLELSGGFRAPH